MRLDGTCTVNWEDINAHKILVRKAEGKRPVETQGLKSGIILK
jgi:hypothetical protein